MKRVITHLIVLICAVTPLLGQEFFEAEHGAQPNHLEPVSPDFSNYRKRIAEHLLVTPADHGLMIARPSFSGESAVAIYEKISKEVLAKHDNLVVLVPNDEKLFHWRPTDWARCALSLDFAKA